MRDGTDGTLVSLLVDPGATADRNCVVRRYAPKAIDMLGSIRPQGAHRLHVERISFLEQLLQALVTVTSVLQYSVNGILPVSCTDPYYSDL